MTRIGAPPLPPRLIDRATAQDWADAGNVEAGLYLADYPRATCFGVVGGAIDGAFASLAAATRWMDSVKRGVGP